MLGLRLNAKNINCSHEVGSILNESVPSESFQFHRHHCTSVQTSVHKTVYGKNYNPQYYCGLNMKENKKLHIFQETSFLSFSIIWHQISISLSHFSHISIYCEVCWCLSFTFSQEHIKCKLCLSGRHGKLPVIRGFGQTQDMLCLKILFFLYIAIDTGGLKIIFCFCQTQPNFIPRRPHF